MIADFADFYMMDWISPHSLWGLFYVKNGFSFPVAAQKIPPVRKSFRQYFLSVF